MLRGRPVANGYMPPADRTDWNTPADVIACVRGAFGGAIDLDPCSNATSLVDARRAYTEEDNGLVLSWSGRTYVNPPFDRLRNFARKAMNEYRRGGCEVIMLMPSRTDTTAWHDHVATASAVCFWKGRITFLGAPAPCPFAVAFVYWGKRVDQFSRSFNPRGMVLRINGR